MENLVTFKTAQLAKSKGFNEPCELFDGFSNELHKQNTGFSNKDPHIIIARPSQSFTAMVKNT
jgi:hypothetical protein